MDKSAGEKATAKVESLLKWINIYVCCSSVEELSSGELLLECARKLSDTVGGSPTNNETPWKHLFSILEEFCGCSLERAVDVKELLSGNQEHISRVVVLLLSLAVQNKNNSCVIAAITSLEYEVQRDLMFFIESTLTKVKSHAIVAGTFTSGIGEVLPSLDTSPASSGHSLSSHSGGIPPATPVRTTSTCSVGSSSQDTDIAFVTPRKPPKRFFNGLDSPAGALLLMSPAITGRRRPGAIPIKDSDDKDQEISRLKHSVRVLEGTLQVEKKLVQEYYEELCSKMEELETLKHDRVHMERKLGCLQNMADLQDELSHTTAQLASAEKAIVNYQTKLSSLEGSREKLLELEGKVGGLEYKASKCDEYKLNMKKSESMLIGKTGELKRAELQMSKLSIELDAKTTHLETLLQENEEHKREVNELKAVQRQLEGNVHQLELELTKKDGERIAVVEESRDLKRELEILKSSMETKQTEVITLGASVLAKDTSIVAMEREKVELQKEIAVKTTQISTMEQDLRSKQKLVEELENKLAHLQSTVKTLEHTASMKEANLKRELAEVKSQLSSKDSDIKTMENIKKTFKNERALLLDTTESLKKDLSDKDVQLSSAKKQIQVLEETTKELECQVSQLHSTKCALEEQKASSSSSADLQIKSLEEAKVILGTSLDKSQALVASLEQDLATKAEDLASLGHANKELEARVKTLEKELQSKNFEVVSFDEIRKQLEEAVKHQSAMEGDLISQLKFSNAEIKSLNKTKLDLEAVISDLKASRKTMKEDTACKVTELAANQGRIKSLAKQNDDLIAEMTAMKKELDEKQDKILQYESEIGMTDKLKDECSQLQAKNLHLTQWVRNLQSSLDTAESHRSSLKTQLESRLETKVTDGSRTGSETISEYGRKREQEMMNRHSQNSPPQGALDHSAAHFNQANLQIKLQAASMREKELATCYQDTEAEHVSEKTKLYNLQGQSIRHVHHPSLYQSNAVSTSTFVVKEDAFVALPLSIGEEDTSTEVTSSECRTDDIFMGTGGFAFDEKARVKELKRRNKQALPHLKSSYPIEMQVRPETPTTSNERLKGARKGRAILHTTSAEKLGSSNLVSGSDEYADLSVSSYSSENSSPRSSTSPRSSATAVKMPRKLGNEPQPIHSSRAPLFPLREFLDKEPAVRPTLPSTTFEVAFSPPKIKGGVPKRLQENRKRQHLKDNERQQKKNPQRKDTALKSKRAAVSSDNVTRSLSATSVHTTSQAAGRSSSLTSRQRTLRSRNN